MKKVKKIFSFLLIIAFLFQMSDLGTVSAATYGNMPAPEKLDVKPIGSLPPIGYNPVEGGSTGYYVDLSWDPLGTINPAPGGSVSKFTNLYVQEITKPYKPSKPIYLKDGNIPDPATTHRMKDLSSGTIYYLSARAYYTYTENSTTFTSPESPYSNQIKVLTDIDISASSYGSNQIKIVWDDVWNTGKRIDYRLYVSDNSAFANTMPIYIGQSQIGSNGPVKVNEATGKLEYIHTVNDPGRVYYVKIVPDVSDTSIKMSAESPTVSASSYILVRTSKMSETDTGTIWKLDWSPVVTGLNDDGIAVTYQIDKYVNDVPIPMLLESGTTTFITIPKGSESNYYIIRANVTINGAPLYPSYIKIVSDKIVVKDQEIPATPSTPEIVNKFDDPLANAGPPIISYDDIYTGNPPVLFKKGELTATSASVLWRVPKKANGDIDTDVTYDIWLVSDPNQIDSPPNNSKVASSVKMTEANYILDGTSAVPVGYKYKVLNLTPNATYYFKVVAKKTYVQFQDNVLKNVEYSSQAALKVIITPALGPIDQPLVPGRPPLMVKKLLDNPNSNAKSAITDTEAIIQLKNKWYEKLIPETVDASGNKIPAHWEYESSSSYSPFTYNGPDQHRKVEYDSGVTIDVGCTKFVEGMDLSTLNTLPASKVMGFPIAANDPDEDATLNIPESINPNTYAKHNIDIKLTGLEPNTAYIIWVRASRQSAGLTSGPSDPLIITTNPTDSNTIEKPIVPTINYTLAGDTYVDLGWDLKTGYNYSIKYGTVDDIKQSLGSAKTSTAEIVKSGLSFLRVKGLSANTLYYFWIQAEATNGSDVKQSEWSDSYPLKTLVEIPPNTPRGFGVKSPQKDNVTKNSITFEWIKEEGMQYVIEIAGGVDYKDAKQFTITDASEYKADNLRSNYRYFARLYAMDPNKGNMKSQPTQSVTVRTLRSSDDYDSDQDIENVLTGDYIVKDTQALNGIWTTKIIGANADRFIEHVQKDKILDYSIDLTVPPSGAKQINVVISSKVFDSLNGMNENLKVATSNTYVTIRPNVIVKSLIKNSGDFNYTISIVYPSTAVNAAEDNLKFKTSVSGIQILAADGSENLPVERLNKPLLVSVPYTGSTWYKEGITAAYIYNQDKAAWEKLKTTNKFDQDNNKGLVSFETINTGNVAIADTGRNYFNDINGNTNEDAITNVAAKHELKSLKGRNFEPDKNAKVSDSVKLAMDVLDYPYGNDFMNVAAKAKLIGMDNLKDIDGNLTRQSAIAMVARMYELKTGLQAVSKDTVSSPVSDLNLVDPTILPQVEFAVENGIVTSFENNKLNPLEAISRGEFMAMLEKLLALVGEID